MTITNKSQKSVKTCAGKFENQQVSFSDQNFKLKKNRIQKKLLNGYSKIHELKLVTIGLASPEKIQSWAEKELPNGKIFGEVTNANTFHYRTFKPSKGGLFCERIFGPLKDFECACGKRKKPTPIESKKILEHEQTTRSFCPNCDVEYTWSILRRYQLGYIKLNAPVTHLWYFKTNPSFLSILFDIKRKDLESIIYCTQTITIENIWKYSEQSSSLTRSPTDLYLKWQKFFSIEQKTKEHQYIFQNKKKKQRQAKEKSRENTLTKNIFIKQANWQNFKTQPSLATFSSFEEFKNSSLSAFPAIAPQQKQKEILVSIYKQKQNKFIYIAIQEIWKKFLQKSYQKSLFFNTLFENHDSTHKHLQKIIQNFSIFFFFSSLLLPGFSVYSKKKNFDFLLEKEPDLKHEKLPSALKKYKRLFYTNEKSIFNDFAFLNNVNNVSVNLSFDSFVKDLTDNAAVSAFACCDETGFGSQDRWQNSEPTKNFKKLNKKKIHKTKFWKSFFFFLEFGTFFVQQKNRKIKNLSKISKKDVLFLFNLLPFLKNYKYFTKTKFVNTDLKKIQIFLQNSVKKSVYQTNSNFDNKIYSVENIQLEIQKIFFKRKSFVSKPNLYYSTNKSMSLFSNLVNSTFHFIDDPMQKPMQKFAISTEQELKQSAFDTLLNTNFVEKKSNMANMEIFLQLFLLKEKISFLQTKQKKNISLHFEKILCFLKTYYEIDFCSFFYNSNFFESLPSGASAASGADEAGGLCGAKKKTDLILESLNVENWDSVFEKNIEILSANLLAKKSQIYPLIEKVSFEYLTFILYLFKSNFVFSSFSNSLERKKEKEQIESSNSLLILLNYVTFVFFSFHKKNKTLNISSNFDNNADSYAQFIFSSKKAASLQSLTVAKKIYIYNKQPSSKVKYHQQKKQIELQKFTEYFSLVSSNQKRKKKIQKKANFENFAEILSANLLAKQSNISLNKVQLPSVAKLRISLGLRSCDQQKTHFSQKVTLRKATPQKTNTLLKNKILTIAYNHVWNNDADWKYFVYYNSFFLYEFEDIPIFIYRSSSSKKKKKSRRPRKTKNSTSKNSYFDFSHKNNFFVGAGILEKLLTEYTSAELRKMTIQHQILLPRIQQTLRFLKQTAKTKKDSLKIQKYFQKREHILRRLKFLRKFSRRNSNPSFMILRNLPVLPPDLRPILKLQNQIAASDLNRLYQRIIYRNERFKKFAKDSATNQSFEMKYAQRLLQEAVDNLIQNGKGSVKAETNSRGQPLKSLSEILKGKQGRFRQYLLGKRVDYSGRSVIVVGPELKLYECGIPKEIALELFLPFLIQYVLKYKLAQTVIGAKNLLRSDSTFTVRLLQKVMKNVPVLLNRAPTLHRLGFQAFLPKLIDGRAILLHPMVCPAFNADFDGDQMAVHIPLTVEARTEAWKFMLSIHNFMNSATGEPVLLPSQDMVLGCFFLTNDFLAKFVGIQFSKILQSSPSFPKLNFYNLVIQNKSFLFFQNFSSVITAYQRKEIFIHTPIWMKANSPVDFGNDSSKPVEIRLQSNGTWEKIHPKYTIIYDPQTNIQKKYIRTTVGRILMNLMIQDCIQNSSLYGS